MSINSVPDILAYVAKREAAGKPVERIVLEPQEYEKLLEDMDENGRIESVGQIFGVDLYVKVPPGGERGDIAALPRSIRSLDEGLNKKKPPAKKPAAKKQEEDSSLD